MANYVLEVFRPYNWVSTEMKWLESRKSEDGSLSVTSDAETVDVGRHFDAGMMGYKTSF